MIYKRFLVFLMIVIAMFVFVGCVQPDSDEKIKETSMQHLKDKYKEDFEFQKEDASWNEGNGWVYSVYAIPKNNPDITVYVKSFSGMSDISDDYSSKIWNRIRKPQVKSLMENRFKAIKDFRFAFSTTTGVRDKYSINDDPLDIAKKEAKLGNTGTHESVSEVISFTIFLDPNEQLDEEKICDDSIYIINYYKKLNLDFMLTINYVNSDKEDGEVARLDLNSNVVAEKNNIKRFITQFKDGKVYVDGKVYKDGKLIGEVNEK